MCSITDRLQRLLIRLEAELRRLELWAERPPSPTALQSTAPFCCDRMGLECWLQWVFLPRMRRLLDRGGSLPARCGIAPMAELYFQQRGIAVRDLIAVLRELDGVIEAGGGLRTPVRQSNHLTK